MRPAHLMDLMKIIICGVPTKVGNFEDYKVIAWFNTALAYVEGHGQWRFLNHCHLDKPVRYSDAIEHGGFIYASDLFHGAIYRWDRKSDGKISIPMM